MRSNFPFAMLTGLTLMNVAASFGQETKPALIPHAQDKPPNDPRDPATAAKMMTVPEGFTVEVVASEPEIVNPVAMTIDERGRYWITESLEYPRREPGPGRDRVKVLEDTDGDGRADKFTVFMEGLNIPSGIAVGYGGVWIANSPDILFVQDTDGDGKADKQEVVVTGFGRADTHELPNSLTWGPDGWLYGLNGVFNHSHVRYSPSNPNYSDAHPGWPLTCALFRIHPRTREFQVFCEGTSNPWGVAFNDDGEAFVSACVIDHLWHLAETGYYHRQGGPYPPFTWKIESIVKHKHQKAAYCGIHYFDTDAWPEKYRGKFYMGNIHGGCINVDRIESNGSTWRGFGEPDFLTANDAWFMPVVQKTGPDGSLYVLDWYDRYHCYQDANRDPAGIDRLKGRLYRVRYGETPRFPLGDDFSNDSDEQLIERLNAKNDFVRDTARRLLQERNTESIGKLLLDRLTGPGHEKYPVEYRRRMFVTLGSLTVPQSRQTRNLSADESDIATRCWSLRFIGDHPEDNSEGLRHSGDHPAVKNSPRAQLQIVVAATKRWRATSTLERSDAGLRELFRQYIDALGTVVDDPALPQIVWQNLHPLLESDAATFVDLLQDPQLKNNSGLMAMMPRIIDRLVARKNSDPGPVVRLVELLTLNQPEIAALGLGQLAARVQNRELSAELVAAFRQSMEPMLRKIIGGAADSPLYLPAAFLATSWGDSYPVDSVRSILKSERSPAAHRLAALGALIAGGDSGVIDVVAESFDSDSTQPALKSQFLASLSKLDDPKLAGFILARYRKLDPELQPRAIELLTQRAHWARQLLLAIGEKQIDSAAINVNQARRLRDLKNPELNDLLARNWGQVRDGRDPDREKYVTGMRQLIRQTPGDPFAGEKAFKKVCAQCHKIYGEGAEVGPDITRNGRNDYSQLLSNVFDPSLVIGSGYRSYTVVTTRGRVLNGLLAEDSPQRIVLKVQGGKQEIIARDEIDEFNVSEISLMPEQLEKQLTQQEIADLMAFLSLDKHPSDKAARKLAGAD